MANSPRWVRQFYFLSLSEESHLDEIELFPLEGTPPYDFRCNRDEQNVFLHARAHSDQRDGFSVTYLAYYKGVTAGYMTLAMDAVPLQTKEKPRSDIRIVKFPAVKLAQLAVDHRWEGRGLGKQLVALAAAIALRLRLQVGCRYLTVDSKADLSGWYESQEFKVNKIARKEQEQRAAHSGVEVESLPISMRLDLFSLLADLHDRYRSDFPDQP